MGAKNNTPVPDQELKVTKPMRRPNNLNPEPQVAPSMRHPIKPDPGSQVIQSMHRPNPSICRPSPARSSVVQAFRQILAQQNDAEYIMLSSGDEDDNY
jgi:hypothetical protein